MNTFTDKTIAAFAARRQFGQILKKVEVKGDRFVVERHGEPVAAVIPIDVYNQAFFQKIRKASSQSNLSPEDAKKLAGKAVKAARTQ